MSFTRRIQYSIGALLLTCVLCFGGIVHALVPHHHGQDHDGSNTTESVMWSDLHGVLSHEGKKLITFAIIYFVIIFFGILDLPAQVAARMQRDIRRRSRIFNYMAGRLLSRGIHPYRAFG